MSIKTKLENNNATLTESNTKLRAIKNAFLRPINPYNGADAPSGVDTSDANATPYDILLGKTAYVNGTKLTGTHVCETIETEEKTATPSESLQEITPSSGKYLSKVTVNAIPSSYVNPSGSVEITENGAYGVKNYLSVLVNVPTPTITFDESTGVLTINDNN